MEKSIKSLFSDYQCYDFPLNRNKVASFLSIFKMCAVEKLHSKKIVHASLKPSKILTNNHEDGHRIFITGFEYCERISSKSANKIQKPNDYKGKRPYENIYSSLNMHNGQSNSYFWSEN